jgi:radical SAM protein with 4Fe4S-binding SPASM domain
MFEAGFANPADEAIRNFRQFDLSSYRKLDEFPWKPSFEVIDRNLRRISRSTKTRVGLRPTATVNSEGRQKELVDYAIQNCVAAVYIDPWAYYLGELPGQPNLHNFANEFLETWRYARDQGLHYGTVFTVNFDEEVEIYCRSCLPAPQFTPDGYVSCCDMAFDEDSFLANVFPELFFGKYIKEENRIEYYQDRIEKIRTRNIRNLPECQGCRVLKHCAGGCIGSGMLYSGDFYGINKQHCSVTRYLFDRMDEAIEVGYDPNVPLHP